MTAMAETHPLTQTMTGADMVVRALVDQGVEVVFGYPGGAVLPIYDALFQQNSLRHILVRHEQAAVHAAEGYARSTGKPGVVLVTSGPGATNAVTGLTDALMDSIPVICLTGQVATHLIGNDAFQEADTTGITRPCTKHNYLVRRVEDLPGVMHEAFDVATHGRPGPVVIDLPKNVVQAEGVYRGPEVKRARAYAPRMTPDREAVRAAAELIGTARRPIFYGGGGLINAGPDGSAATRDFVEATGWPCTLTLMGLGVFPASDPRFLGMLGMHGLYEANNAMHDCDVMFNVGARFDDRVTGRLDAFSPDSKKIHIDIDPSSINKNVPVDIPIVGDAAISLRAVLEAWREMGSPRDEAALKDWWAQIEQWRAIDCLKFRPSADLIRPQYAVKRLADKTRHLKPIITTEVGQHQMWAAQYIPFDSPNLWLTSGGLGTMGYGLPAAIGAQIAHPDKLVIDVAGEASILMNIQELSTAVQYRTPVKVFILNNEYMGMVRQWQELLHGGRYAESYSEALPDFVKLAEAFGGVGLRATTDAELDVAIDEMMKTDRPTVMDICVDPKENCYPMIPSGKAHNEMLLNPEDFTGDVIDAEGRALV